MSLAFPQWRAVMGALVLSLCLLMLSGAAGRAQAACGPGDFVPHQIIVKLNPITGATVEQINATYGSTTLETFPGSTDVNLLELPAGSGVTETVERMASDPRLLYAEPNFFAQPPEGGARHHAWGVSDVAPASEEYAAQALRLRGQRQESFGPPCGQGRGLRRRDRRDGGPRHARGGDSRYHSPRSENNASPGVRHGRLRQCLHDSQGG